MATDDQQVLVTGQETAPASWVVPGNGQIRPKVVFATFDGTGAAGDFKPCLRIVSDGGEIIGESAADEAVTAGASVDASWFPRVGAPAGGTPTPTAPVMPYATVSLGDWVWTQPGSTSVDWTAATVSITDSSVFTNNIGTDPGTPILIEQTGIYLAYGSIGPLTTAWGTQFSLVSLGPDIGSLIGDQGLSNAVPLTFVPLSVQHNLSFFGSGVFPTVPVGGGVLSMEVNQNSGTNRHVSAFLGIVQLTSNGAGI